MTQERNDFLLSSFLLRSGLAVVFLYAALSSLMNPSAWIGYVPALARSVISAEAILMIHAVAEGVLAFWLLSNKKITAAALIAAADLFVIVLSNLAQLDIVFRDVALLFAALALAVLSSMRRRK